MNFIKLFLFYLFFISITLQANDNIKIYNAYGNSYEVIIEGRLLHKKVFEKAEQSDSWYKNLYRRLRELINDEIKNKKVEAVINGEKFYTKSDDEGYFQFDIDLKNSLKSGYQNINLKIKNNSNIHKTKATIIANKKMIGIISDFDDTIVISNVPTKLKLLYNILFKNYMQRKVVKGMKEKFQKILTKNPKTMPIPLFILSASPQQLFNPIEKFLNYHNFPKHVLILKKAHGSNKDPLTDQYKYKMQKIEKLIKLYPKIKWIMFGDSGEKDREVYESIAKKYPQKVLGYYIRDVKSGEIKKYNLK